MDAYARLVAMKLVGLRAADYMRAAGPDDRRYLLFSPIVKMKVTTQGEDVINHLWDVIAARGFENDTYFETAARDIRALPKAHMLEAMNAYRHALESSGSRIIGEKKRPSARRVQFIFQPGKNQSRADIEQIMLSQVDESLRGFIDWEID